MPKKDSSRNVVKALITNDKIITENSDAAKELAVQGGFGKQLDDGRIQLSFLEAFYLIEKKKIKVFDGRNKEVEESNFLKKAKKSEHNFWTRYAAFKDIRNRGYIIKTALKFGADFRIYDRGVKPGDDHSKWVLFPVHEGSTLTWHDFASKNRVAHSTKKRLLIGIVDDESDITYYEIRWVRP